MMKTCLRNICLITSFLLLFACSREAKVIPRGKMAQIYAEMLVTDQWINSTPSVKRMADTSLVYEPILEKYGSSSADYRKSVETYMDDFSTYAGYSIKDAFAHLTDAEDIGYSILNILCSRVSNNYYFFHVF